jgi:parallel beta-helix repeat protein
MRIRRILTPPTPESAPSSLSFSLPAIIAALALATFLGSRAIAEDPPILVASGESIQAAIDKAPSGAVIQLGEGEWKERIVITKALTLEGAGWEKTRITVEEPLLEDVKGIISELEAAVKAASTPEQKKVAARDRVARLIRPAVWVHDASAVKLQKLRLQGVSKGGREEGGTASTLLIIQGAKAAVSDCAFVGPFGNGINIAEASEVAIARSLVAAFWGEGIIVRGRGRDAGEDASRLHLVDSEIRNVYHYGIVIGGGCDSTVIERCWISGTAWHGIRYDSASPTIIGNFIYGNARFGIYASGNTKAKLRGNVVWQNDMEGVWCLSGNSDLIEGNTFVANRRGGIAVSDARPSLTRNIIASSPVGIAATAVARQDGQSAVGEPVFIANLFHGNQAPLRVGEEDQPAPDGSVIADPKFRDVAKLDFGLANDSPARAAGIGAVEPLPASSRWPILAEEKSIIPADDTRDSTKWRAPGAPVASIGSPAAASPDKLATPAPNPNAELVEKNRQAARVRANKDRETYPVDQLREIETLYQVANAKGKRSPEARESLTQLLQKYDKANRTGCATLYLGQASEGEERLKYLTTAVEKFSDCYYFNGCQVGGYGRYVLLLTLWDRGEKDKALSLLNELKTTYKDTTGHRGERMGDVAESVEKQLEAQPK